MSRARLSQGLGIWVLLTFFAACAGHCRMDIAERTPPSDELGAWALEALGGGSGDAPGEWTGEGPTVVTAWRRGAVAARFVGDAELSSAIAGAREYFASEAPSGAPGEGVEYTVEVIVGIGPLALATPFLRELSLVPMHEGLLAELDGEIAILTPEELLADRAYDGGVNTPIPELTFGSNVLGLLGRMARDLRSDRDTLLADGDVQRTRSHSIRASTYPLEMEVTEENLRRASVEGADFLLRNQFANGMYTYIYEGSSGRTIQDGYNIPRHSGTTYYLAQVDHLHGHPPARRGALRALRWLEANRLQTCGETPCVVDFGRADVGSAALTVVAAAEVLQKEEDAVARRLVEGLSAFLRAQQRDDGELMHEYDIEANAPIDVQHMYYSGEAAFALLKAHEATGDEANLEAARRLMTHLTGASWDFLGSRYYYGEEHWTCIAAGEARDRVPSEAALDFCKRWYEWNDGLQYRAGDTPWSVEGAYGVGPVIVPRLTPVGSRTEAFIGTYLMMRSAGLDTSGVRAVVERALAQLLRWRWAPGPTHLLADPEGAHGAMPGSLVDLTARNDFTQHAGSAWIRWADVLREEREAREGASQ